MRPLIDLTPLSEQPSVFDQTTDDFASYFADEFTSVDGANTSLTADQGDSQTGYALFGGEVDALSSMVNAAGAALDLLSLDLDTVDLTPEILNFQAADSALDSSLSNVTFDFTDAIAAFAQWALQLIQIIIGFVTNLFTELQQQLELQLLGATQMPAPPGPTSLF